MAFGPNRRRFLCSSTGLAAVALSEAAAQAPPPAPPLPFPQLKPMTEGIRPIPDEEREARIERARALMREHRLDAIFLEPGSSMFYYTGVRWGTSERTFALVLPASGEPAWIVPAFEEGRAREVIRSGKDIRVWQEDESPFKVAAGVIRDRGARFHRVGFEENVRFFVFDGIRQELPGIECASAGPVTVGCRSIKSPAELALMQRANDITVVAYRAAIAGLKEGMTNREFGGRCRSAFAALGVDGGALVIFGRYTEFPHGSSRPQKLQESDLVLMDGGCSVEGYRSDVTRTLVFGKPNERQVRAWNLARRAQDAALAASRPGVPCEAVDAAARKVITEAGYGPGYKVPGCPHRIGHGIGLEGHEWLYLVRGNKAPLRPGMCFSNEPTIVIPGEFGIRVEDCMHITEDGARLFTPQSPSIDRPLA